MMGVESFDSVLELAFCSIQEYGCSVHRYRRRLVLSGRYPLRRQHAFQGGLDDLRSSYNPGYRPRTSPVGTDLRAVRRRRRGPSGEIALPPEASLENPNPIVQPRLSPEDLLGRDRSPSGPAEGWTARPG